MEQTARALNLPQERVNDVLKYFFSSLVEELSSPSVVGYRLEDFGMFSTTHRKIACSYSVLLTIHRRKNNQLTKLRKLARLRYQVALYKKTRKFKERFGSWHWK